MADNYFYPIKKTDGCDSDNEMHRILRNMEVNGTLVSIKHEAICNVR